MEDDEARAILREHGEEPPKRGRLAPQWHTRAEALRQDAPPAESYDAGVTAEDFISAAADPPEPEAPAIPAERRPRRPQRNRTAPTIRERITKARTGPKTKAKKKLPRVTVAPLTSNLWAAMGGLVLRMDAPVGRCLIMQSDAAGDMLDDLIKDTFVDTVAQPLARAEKKGRKVAALFGPPAVIAAIERAQMLPEAQRQAREALLFPVLISLLMLWDDESADKAEERLERTRLEGPKREQAERIALMILNGTAPQPTPEPAPAAA